MTLENKLTVTSDNLKTKLQETAKSWNYVTKEELVDKLTHLKTKSIAVENDDGAVVANFYSNELGGAFDIKNKYGKEMLGFSIFNPGVPYFRLSDRDGYKFFTLCIYVDDDIASNPLLSLGSSKTKQDALVARADENGGRLFLNGKSGQRRIDFRMYTNADTQHLDLYDENGYAFFSTGTYTENDHFLRLGSSKTKQDVLVARGDENGGSLRVHNKDGERSGVLAAQQNGDGQLRLISHSGKGDKVIMP